MVEANRKNEEASSGNSLYYFNQNWLSVKSGHQPA